ncbi:MAG: YwiC-like family protein [Holophaga sp.]
MSGSARPTPSLWPREHGAYAQLGVALAAALALAWARGVPGPALRALAQAVLTAAAFMGSEPLLVLSGRRGTPEPGGTRAAWRRLAGLGGLGALCALGAWTGQPPWRLASLVPAALLGAVLLGLFLAKRERTAAGELAAAWTFAAAALAVAAAGGVWGPKALALALVLAALFTLGTAIVHGHILALRRGTPWPRMGAFLLGAALAAGAWRLGRAALLPPACWAAFVPMTLAALGMWLLPPAPRRLKAVGWAAAACALAGAALAVAVLQGS